MWQRTSGRTRGREPRPRPRGKAKWVPTSERRSWHLLSVWASRSALESQVSRRCCYYCVMMPLFVWVVPRIVGTPDPRRLLLQPAAASGVVLSGLCVCRSRVSRQTPMRRRNVVPSITRVIASISNNRVVSSAYCCDQIPTTYIAKGLTITQRYRGACLFRHDTKPTSL